MASYKEPNTIKVTIDERARCVVSLEQEVAK